MDKDDYEKLKNDYERLVNQYNAVVEQNKQLQTELNNCKKLLDEYKDKNEVTQQCP